jgi:WD40 repeat protein
VSGGKDARLRFWNSDTGIKEHEIEAHNFAIYDLKFSPDGQMAASASFDKTAKIWDATTFDLIARIEAPETKYRRSMNCVKWITNELVALAGDDKLVSLWQIKQDD